MSVSSRLHGRLLSDGGRLFVTLLVGAVGGAVFAWLRMPLAWMIGAMFATTIASLAGAPLRIPARFRAVMIAVLGVLLGSAFSPEILDRLAQWAAGGVVQVVFIVVLTALSYIYLRRAAGLDRITSFFSSTPGGLTTMSLLGESLGADVRVISLIHATRVLFVVTVIPFYFRIVHGIGGSAFPPTATSLLTIDPLDALVLAVAGLVGVPLGHMLRLPAPYLVGPIVASAAAHLTGIAHAAPPTELVAAAQVVVGASIGARFTGLPVSHVGRIMRIGAGSSLLMLLTSAVVGSALAPLIGTDAASLVLALAPGGLAEMALTALSLGVDTAFVSTMHILRIAVIVIMAPLAFRLLSRSEKSGG